MSACLPCLPREHKVGKRFVDLPAPSLRYALMVEGRGAFVTRPLFRHSVHTRRRLTVPFNRTFTRWRFGRKRRRFFRVVRRPTPPFFFN